MELITPGSFIDRADTVLPAVPPAVWYRSYTGTVLYRRFFKSALSVTQYHYLIYSGTGNSKAIDFSGSSERFLNYWPVLLSSISGGSVTVEFSLSPMSDVLDGTAWWVESAISNIVDSAFFMFGDPFQYIRIVAADGVSWTVEARNVASVP